MSQPAFHRPNPRAARQPLKPYACVFPENRRVSSYASVRRRQAAAGNGVPIEVVSPKDSAQGVLSASSTLPQAKPAELLLVPDLDPWLESHGFTHLPSDHHERHQQLLLLADLLAALEQAQLDNAAACAVSAPQMAAPRVLVERAIEDYCATELQLEYGRRADPPPAQTWPNSAALTSSTPLHIQERFVEPKHTVAVVALAGGPGSGKTTCLAGLRQKLEEAGYKVFVAFEVATFLGLHGYTYLSEQDPERNPASANFFDCVIALERLMIHRAQTEFNDCPDKPCVVITDRGLPCYGTFALGTFYEDCLAQWCTDSQTILCGYSLVLHMTTTAKIPGLYEQICGNNSARKTTAKEAIEQDDNSLEIWAEHPNRIIVDNPQTGHQPSKAQTDAAWSNKQDMLHTAALEHLKNHSAQLRGDDFLL